jgi:hypothetical protein
MFNFARILRLISLAMLFGGSSGIVFAAIVLVTAAKAQGVPVAQAAAVNAPIFIEFSKVALAFALALVLSEAIQVKGDLPHLSKQSKWALGRYFASTVCALATFVFALAIVPPMEKLLPHLKTEETARLEFRKLHETSRAVFMTIIVFAMASLIIPPLSSRRTTD